MQVLIILLKESHLVEKLVLGERILESQPRNLVCYMLYVVFVLELLINAWNLMYNEFFSVLLDKGKSAKEEARELLLREEASIREKVLEIKNNLSLILRALGEIAIANPIFAHSQLPSLVCVLQVSSS